MIKTKIYFTILIFILAILIVGGAIFEKKAEQYNLLTQIQENLTEIRVNSVIENSLVKECAIQKPENKTIILRIDDIAAYSNVEVSKTLVNEILTQNLSITLGVIPKNLGDDKQLIQWLNEIKNEEEIEIAQHGYLHEENEFMTLSEEEASEKIIEGRRILTKYISIAPITFIPPYNEYSRGTLESLKELGFKIISSGHEELQIEDDVALMGYTARTYEFDENRYVPVEEVLNDCQNSLNEDGICVLMFHPQDYRIGETKQIDRKKFEDFKTILAELQNYDAEFKTFEGAFCEQ